MISNSVTHLQNSQSPILPETPRDRQRRRAEVSASNADIIASTDLRAIADVTALNADVSTLSADISAASTDIVASNDDCFMMFHNVLLVVHDVLQSFTCVS